MCGNRVEELEARVKELEASVEGLTDELVECKVRIRELENVVDEDIGFATEEAEEPEPSGESPAEATKTEDTDEQDSTESGSSDIIIA